jgi:hypothetical protein
MESDGRRRKSGSAADKDSEWARRRLCSDGNCIGVIGADGRCKECGKPHAGEQEDVGGEDAVLSPAEEPEGPAPAEADDFAPADAEAEEPGVAAQVEPAPEPGTDDWADRRLCSDGNCIGVIGPDGRCKECGKPFTG